MSVIYPRMAVIGCGLIGSSVIRAAREAGVVGVVAVADASEAHRQRIVELGYADEVAADIAEAVKDADLVVLAVPVLAMGEAAKAAAAALKPGATVTDVGSVKGSVADALAAALPDSVFIIPGHPIAGTEHSGPDAGLAELFQNRWVILTPKPEPTSPISRRWAGCRSSGARWAPMSTRWMTVTTIWSWPSPATCPT